LGVEALETNAVGIRDLLGGVGKAVGVIRHEGATAGEGAIDRVVAIESLHIALVLNRILTLFIAVVTGEEEVAELIVDAVMILLSEGLGQTLSEISSELGLAIIAAFEGLTARSASSAEELGARGLGGVGVVLGREGFGDEGGIDHERDDLEFEHSVDGVDKTLRHVQSVAAAGDESTETASELVGGLIGLAHDGAEAVAALDDQFSEFIVGVHVQLEALRQNAESLSDIANEGLNERGPLLGRPAVLGEGGVQTETNNHGTLALLSIIGQIGLSNSGQVDSAAELNLSAEVVGLDVELGVIGANSEELSASEEVGNLIVSIALNAENHAEILLLTQRLCVDNEVLTAEFQTDRLVTDGLDDIATSHTW